MSKHDDRHGRHERGDEGQAAEQERAESPGDRIAALEREVAELRDQKLRSIAELDNMRRRAQQQAADTVRYANENLLRQVLPILDDFERSLESSRDSHAEDGFYQGVEMIERKFRKLLESLGVHRIDTVGKPFDVNLHDAILRQPSEAPEDTVITEVEPGYMVGDRVLRHAKVIVSAGA